MNDVIKTTPEKAERKTSALESEVYNSIFELYLAGNVLNGVRVSLDALAKEGRDDRFALELLSRAVEKAYNGVIGVAESLETAFEAVE